MKHFQARRSGGRFTRNTMENTLGLHCAICANRECGALNPSRLGEPQPTHCHKCGQELLSEALADFKDIQSDARVTPDLSRCLYCSVSTTYPNNGVKETQYQVPLDCIKGAAVKQCPACKRIYLLQDPTGGQP